MLIPIIQITGLVFDLIGVVIMAREIIILDKTIGTWDWLDNSMNNAKRNRRYTLWGLGFIAVGFFLQIVSVALSLF